MKYLGILILFSFFPSIILSQSFSIEKQQKIDSLNNVIATKNSPDTSLAAAYLGLSEILYVSDLDTIIPLCKKTIEITEKSLLKNPPLQTKKKLLQYLSGALNNIGYVLKVQGNLVEALSYYNKSLNVDKELGDKLSMATSYNNIGVIYDVRADIPKALEYYHKSLKIKEELGNKKGISNSLINIGQLYEKQGEPDKALEYYNRTLKINEDLGDKRGISQSLNNIGSIYAHQQDFNKGLSYYQKSLALKKELGDPIGTATLLNNIGSVYDKQNNFNLALEYYLKSLEIKKEVSDKSGVSFALYNVGSVLLKQGKIANAENKLTQSLTLAQEVNAPELIRNASELLSKLYEEQNQASKALNMHKLFITMRDSIINMETQKAIITKSLQYDFDKKEALAKAEHEKELALKEAEKNKQNIIIWAGSIVLILIIGVSIFIANRLKISNQQKLLIEQKNQENELLLGEIHHRVKNNLQVISSLLSLQERNIDDEKTKAAILEGKERVKSMGLIHKMLYQNDNYSGVEMDDYGKELIQGLVDSFGMKKEDLDLNLNFSNLKLDVDTAIPIGLIINELVINSLKYAYNKTNTPALKISLAKESNKLVLEVADNGNGQADDLKNSKSFGMKLIKSLSRQIGGIVSIEGNAGIRVKIDIANYKLV